MYIGALHVSCPGQFPYENNEAQRSTLYLMITYRKFNEKASKSSWYINVENKY